MKLKKLATLALAVSALASSVSAIADAPATPTNKADDITRWDAKATVETSTRLIIKQGKEYLNFNYIPELGGAVGSFSHDQDTIKATLLSGKALSNLVIKAKLDSNTLLSGVDASKTLKVNAKLGNAVLSEKKYGVIFSTDGNVSLDDGGAFSDLNLPGDWNTSGSESKSIMDFTIPVSSVPDEGVYTGTVVVKFYSTWVEE